jgi:hypothetical protein
MHTPIILSRNQFNQGAWKAIIYWATCCAKKLSAAQAEMAQFQAGCKCENGSAKVCHGSGGIILLRAE